MTKKHEGNCKCGTRERILDVAKALFIERGFAEVSMADIASAAGIQKPSLYYFFESKAHIYCGIMCDIVRRILPPAIEGLRAAVGDGEPEADEGRERLQSVLQGFVRGALEAGTVVRHKDLAVIKSEYPLPPEVMGMIDEARNAFEDFLRHHSVKDPDMATDVIISSTHSYIFRKKHSLTEAEPEEFVTYLSGLVMNHSYVK